MLTIPTDLKNVKALRDFYTTQRQAVCGMADLLDEPWKSHFAAIKGEYDKVLSALPPSDQVPAALDANSHISACFSMFYQINGLCAMLASRMSQMKTEHAAAVNSAVTTALEAKVSAGEFFPKAVLETKIGEAVTAKVTAGELVEKSTVTQLCSAAETKGFGLGEKKVRDEIAAQAEAARLTETRKTELATASLPVPEGELLRMLALPDAEYATAKQKAEARIESLRSQGVLLKPGHQFLSNVWLPDEKWNAIEKLAVETLKSGGAPLPTPNPNPSPGAAPNILPLV
jgi:hypothetical protein